MSPASTTSSYGLTSTLSSTIGRKIGTSGRRVLIDTSILVDLKGAELARLSERLAISALSVAELARGRNVAASDLEKERRRRHLELVEASLDALPFELACAQAFGLVAAAIERIGRRSRGARSIDLMIAATALAHRLPLYTINMRDLRGFEGLIEIVDVGI